jgi:RNA recognition motif-containing protein
MAGGLKDLDDSPPSRRVECAANCGILLRGGALLPSQFVRRSGYMTKRLYVGNLGWEVTDEELGSEAGRYGAVVSARVITDRDTGRSRGFGFLEVEDSDATTVISGLNGREFMGRTLTVNEARERENQLGGGGRGPRNGRGAGSGRSGRSMY